MAMMAVYSQNLSEPFLRAVLPTNVEVEHSSNGGRQENKSTRNSTTKVKFNTKILCLGQCTTAITMV